MASYYGFDPRTGKARTGTGSRRHIEALAALISSGFGTGKRTCVAPWGKPDEPVSCFERGKKVRVARR